MNTGKKIVYLVTYVCVFALAFLMLRGDAASFLKWWGALFVIGLACLPMTTVLFRGFHDKGYLFAKPIGMALAGYLLWLLSSMKILKFTSLNGILCVILLALPNLYLFYSSQKKNKTIEPLFSKENIETFFKEELFFLLLFLLWCYIKGFKAEAYGTEKFMDYGFMTSMMRADYMPPYDLWYSGGVINYYYFGQYLATFITKISGVTVNVGYNFMLMTIAALSTLLPYSIVSNVTAQMLQKKQISKPWLPPVSGILGGLILSCSSNLHFPIFRWVVPALQEMLGIEVSSYWFPDATRYIGYQPETSDKTIHEFPAYSTVLGDLHAHYINIIFVLTVVGLLFAWYIRQEQQRDRIQLTSKLKFDRKECLTEILEPGILMITFFIGMFHMTNFWDFPIYFVVSGAVILFSNLVKYQFHVKAWIMTGLQGVFVVIGSSVVALPFTLQFDQISTEICISQNHTPFYQLMILWGVPVIVVIGFICSCISDYRKNKEGTEENNTIWMAVKTFFMKIDFTDLFIILLGLCAIGLVMMPEVIYVKDIYSGDYKRANTMFKLTYQAFIMFSMCSGYVLMKHLIVGTTARQKRYARVGLILSVLTICYIGHSVKAWFGNVFDFDARGTLDAAEFMVEQMPDDSLAIDWLNENVDGQAVVLEANGDSYSDYERISVMTGLQTVAGWYVHEWLWRGDTDTLNKRNEDIQTIYTSTDWNTVSQLVEQYDIDYIYIGTLEYEKYGTIATDIITQMGEVVYSAKPSDGTGNQIYIVKIAK